MCSNGYFTDTHSCTVYTLKYKLKQPAVYTARVSAATMFGTRSDHIYVE